MEIKTVDIGRGKECVACKRLSRHYIGFEINSEYCEMVNRRLENERTLWSK